ncbi:MAG: hypothetical protein QOC70_2362 [Verrucomicrobiota bacterium]
MLKGIVGIIASYIVMAIFITVVFIGLFLVLGVERVFQPDSYEVSMLWLIISAIISFCSALLGGYVCFAISNSMRACQVLALIVLVLGVLLCLPKMREDPHVRAGDVPTLQVMQLAQMPVWMHVLSPVLGAVGILLGARMKKPL